MTSPPRTWHDYSRSKAVLIGTWSYTHLTPVPAAQHSLQRMRALLTSPWCSWPEQRVTVVADHHSPGNLADFLVSQYADVRDVALFYYVGHGQIDDEDQLCFSLVGSRPEPHRRATTSLPFDTVRRALLRSNAATKILILDCCFSGLATRREHALGPLVDEVMERTTGTGAYTMAASSAYSAAWFETDPQIQQPQTYFTKYLADLVNAGIPGQPSALGLHTLFSHVRESLARDQRPVPHERSVDAARDYVFARNAAPLDTQIDLAAEVERLRREKAQAQARERVLREQAARLTQELQQLRRERETQAAQAGERPLREQAARPTQELRQARNRAPSNMAPFTDEGQGLQVFPGSSHQTPEPPSPQEDDAAPSDSHNAAITSPTAETPQPADLPDSRKTLPAGSDAKNHAVPASQIRESQLALSGNADNSDETSPPMAQRTITLGHLRVSRRRLLGTATAVGLTGIGTTAWALTSFESKAPRPSAEDKSPVIAQAIIKDPVSVTETGPPLTGFTGSVNSVAFSPDGVILAAGAADKTVRMWNVADNPSHPTPIGPPLTGYTGSVNSVAFDKNFDIFAVGCSDGTIWVGYLSNPGPVIGQQLIRDEQIDSVVFGPNGQFLAASAPNKTVQLWDVPYNGRATPLGYLTSGSTNTIASESIAFSHDGNTLAAGCSDGVIRLWDVSDPAHASPIAHLLGANSAVNSVALSRDGILAAGDQDGIVWIWHVANRANPVSYGRLRIATLGNLIGIKVSIPKSVNSIAFSPDGRTLATTDPDHNAVQLWTVS